MIRTPAGTERVYQSYSYTLRGTVCYVSLEFGTLNDVCAVTYDVGNGRLYHAGVPQAQAKVNMTYQAEIVAGEPYRLSYSAYPLDESLVFAGWEYEGKIYAADAPFDLSGRKSVTLKAVYEAKEEYVTWTFHAGEGELIGGGKTLTVTRLKGSAIDLKEVMEWDPSGYWGVWETPGNPRKYLTGWDPAVPATMDTNRSFTAVYSDTPGT